MLEHANFGPDCKLVIQSREHLRMVRTALQCPPDFFELSWVHFLHLALQCPPDIFELSWASHSHEG
eukprot:scaffold198657_cov10-Tisochrysis_lutea.AAC.1